MTLLQIEKMPKVELHVHLESTIEGEKSEKYARAQGKVLARSGGADCRLLLSLDRGQSQEMAVALVEKMVACRTPQLAGLSIDGNEKSSGSNNQRFASAFAMARNAGFGCTAHAGESSGPEGVAEALDILQVDRLDHGVRAVEEHAVLARVVAEKVPLNICLSSNLALVYQNPSDHPLKKLHSAGAVITLNRDDPTFLGGLTLSQELLRCAKFGGFSLEDLTAMERNAIQGAFCQPEVKEKLQDALAKWLQEQ